ncbi:MAG TPA: hypothetical protein VGK90_11300, partial [Rhizomicrobium sp.]
MRAVVGVENYLALGRSGFAVALCAALLPQTANALAGGAASQGELQQEFVAGRMHNPALALAPGFAPPIANSWTAMPVYHAAADSFDEDANSPSFDTNGYDAMWDDSKFSEIAAYGGLARDALRVAGMRAIDGSDGASGAIPYGRLTLERESAEGHNQFALGAYGTQVGVRQTAISGFGDDSYTDVAMDGTWRWIAHPERNNSDAISAHILVLHEGQSLLASSAIFGTRKNDSLNMFRGDVSWSLGDRLVPAAQYFQITGTSDPV